jgi:transmembrane sensor
MNPSDKKPRVCVEADPEEKAAAEFVCGGHQLDQDSQEGLQDPRLAVAREKVERAWEGVGQNANRPEFLALREQALARARRANRRRWSLPWTATQQSWGFAASLVGVALAAGIVWQLSPYGYRPGVYQTSIGEQRTIELADHSRIALDSDTRISATMSADARTIEIIHGQAQFNVLHDPARPFKVKAGDHTIVDVGTVFTVDYEDQTVQVALIEGKVTVLTPNDPKGSDAAGSLGGSANEAARSEGEPPQAIELSAGEAVRFARNGNATVTAKADIDAATAWREGKVIFHSEPLAEAVRRLNRYSKVQLKIDGDELSDLKVSGVFETGDSRAFADAVQAYLPVAADYSQNDVIKLRMK